MIKPGVSLADCIKSGLAFRRPGEGWVPPGAKGIVFTANQVVATDWEIKQSPLTFKQHSRINGHFRGSNRRGWIAIDFDEQWIGRNVEIVVTEID